MLASGSEAINLYQVRWGNVIGQCRGNNIFKLLFPLADGRPWLRPRACLYPGWVKGQRDKAKGQHSLGQGVIVGLHLVIWLISDDLFSAECYLQVMQTSTDPVDNLQHLLRLPIFDKSIVTFHKMASHRNYTNCFLLVRENKSTHNLDSLRIVVKMIIAERMLFG